MVVKIKLFYTFRIRYKIGIYLQNINGGGEHRKRNSIDRWYINIETVQIVGQVIFFFG